MTRQEYIEAVKAKLDEISPFGEPDSFIAASGDSDYDKVKPVVSYIDSELDRASHFCLQSLPLTLLGEDITTDNMNMSVDSDGVGHIKDMYEYLRLIRLSCSDLDRDITAFISSSSPLYLLQQNKYTRGGYAKPVAAYNPEGNTLEVYSVNDKKGQSVTVKVSYIDATLKAESVQSNISRFIIIRTAMEVARILQDANTSAILEKEWTEELSPILN